MTSSPISKFDNFESNTMTTESSILLRKISPLNSNLRDRDLSLSFSSTTENPYWSTLALTPNPLNSNPYGSMSPWVGNQTMVNLLKPSQPDKMFLNKAMKKEWQKTGTVGWDNFF